MHTTNMLNPEDLYMEFHVKKKSGRSLIITPDGSEPVFEKVSVGRTLFKALSKAYLWQIDLNRKRFAKRR